MTEIKTTARHQSLGHKRFGKSTPERPNCPKMVKAGPMRAVPGGFSLILDGQPRCRRPANVEK
jgi:hypothetical protein